MTIVLPFLQSYFFKLFNAGLQWKFIPTFFSVPDVESYPPIEAIVHGDQLQLLQLPESDIEVQSKQMASEKTYSNFSRFNTLEVAYNDEIFVTTNTSSTVLFELSNTNKVTQENTMNYMHFPTNTLHCCITCTLWDEQNLNLHFALQRNCWGFS